ncbi:EF-hand superfamily Ca2+-modulated protein [Aspergillus heteromorphus CBS 117.55]|uniref:Calmodulin n=1 Tax=Aspergillus heteromorphus CBS 117.55 TaxID=1448321 RepID=A0A317UX21_9EURO|nr:EF-hand superfamily Ca2+-modulated protein [Aspergillus heteromorphus CBS 117.55]PWY65578.1 EF-hand superfamily Ca2+-modulated protein [Aspergillus heteromorphus CBS 117.55]
MNLNQEGRGAGISGITRFTSAAPSRGEPSNVERSPQKARPPTTASPAPKRRARQSKLAKENDISAEEENEIKEVFELFHETVEEFADEKEGVIPREDVRKALVALGLPPTSPNELQTILSALDPTNTGYVPYAPFVTVAAAKLHSRSDDSSAMLAEVDAAFRLFTRGSDGPITLGHLRRIARELKEDGLGDELLKDMILEANGGVGVSDGVSRGQFRDVMARAGVF